MQFNDPHYIWLPSNCDTLLHCFQYYTRYGINSGDLGNPFTLGQRWTLDFAYFFLVFILLNIVKGITIDTFVELRMKKNERLEDTTEKCFICGFERLKFDRAIGRTAFEMHIKLDHNLWNYAYFVMYLWEQDQDDDDGLEQYVRRAVAANDISWFPMNKCLEFMALEEAAADKNAAENNAETRFTRALGSLESKLHKTIGK